MKLVKPTIIGSVEEIDFPKIGYSKIPAKVDTGADGSVIWASDIEVTPKGLQFVLFDKRSPHYNGKSLTAKDYRVTTVKNSSGEKQLRYKVRLSVRVSKRRIKAWFSLADRSSMRYPILLGRKLLKDKFVVDVSKRNNLKANGPQRILILASPSDQPRLEKFAGQATAKMSNKTEIVVCSYGQLTFWVETGNVSVREMVTQSDIADFDLVYFKSHRHFYEFAISAARYLSFKRVRFMDEELLKGVSYDKLSELITMALSGLPVPPAFCASNAVLEQNFPEIKKRIGPAFVCKEINSDRGRKNYLISGRRNLAKVLAESDANDIFMAQQYVENDGFLRIYVFKTDVGLVVKYDAVGHAQADLRHINKPSDNSNTRIIDAKKVPSAVYDLAWRSSRLLGRQIAGVDLLQDINTKEWYILEVNSNPQIVSGPFVPQKQAALAYFIDNELER